MAGGSSPCASCKLLRRRCAKDCIFAPYFPPHDPLKFAMVHKVFGASNVSKMLQELPVDQRADAVSSLVFEANARLRDPVYGCVGAIFSLQNQVSQLQLQLAVAQAELQMMQSHQHQHQHPTHNYSRFIFEDIHQQEQDGGNSSSSCHFSSSNLAANMSHCFGIVSSPSSVFQDPLKQESLWT